jgi:hypothetical protein
VRSLRIVELPVTVNDIKIFECCTTLIVELHVTVNNIKICECCTTLIVELHVTVNNIKIFECCTTIISWRIYVAGKNNVLRSSCKVPDIVVQF